MRIKFKNLMLEITRQCGMNCNHCMRGEAEDVDMKYDVIYTICEKATHIEQLSITGGEPSLAPEKIDLLANRLSYNGCTIGSFFCATNAQHYSESFVAALNLLYKQCKNPEKCILSISTDQFHSGADPKALEEYRKLPYYSPVKEKGYLPPHKILNEGRAADNGIGTFDALYDQEFYDVEFKGFDLIVNDRVYINVFGDILLEPDARYSAQNEISVGNFSTRWSPPRYSLFANYNSPKHCSTQISIAHLVASIDPLISFDSCAFSPKKFLLVPL